MNKANGFVSKVIIFFMATVFIVSASFFALNYNRWFVNTNFGETETISAADLRDGKIHIGMQILGIDKSDNIVIDEANTYGFPVGETPYFIYVEKGGHTLSIFMKDAYGFYTVHVATWSTATGKSASMTPVGVFQLGKRDEWHVWPSKNVSPYSTTYFETNNRYGGLFIHGPIYSSRNFRMVFSNSVRQIGTNCSSGCLRTEVEAAYFVYTMCEQGTMVKIVEGSPLGFTPYRKVTIGNQKIEPNLEHFSLSTVSPDKIEFAESSRTLTVGEKYTPEMIVTPSYAGNVRGTWTTNNPSVVKVNGNTLMAVSTGSAIVLYTTEKGGITASMLINVIVDSVNTSANPPKVGGGVIHNSDNITSDYQPISESLIYLKIDDTNFYINQKAKPLIEKLGYKYYVNKAQSCAYTGEDKVYTYTYKNNGTCQLSTIPLLDGEDTICEISIRNNITKALESSKGIKIGSTLADIEKAYGKFYTQEFVEATATSDAYTRVIYWAGEPNTPGVAYLYFILDADGKNVTGMGIFSARNLG